MGACSNLSPVEKCLAIIAHGANALLDGNFTLAEGAFRVALAGAKTLPPKQGHGLMPLALLNMSRLRGRQNREDDARQLREQAIAYGIHVSFLESSRLRSLRLTICTACGIAT